MPITDFIFFQLVTAYKRVTLQAHAHKPTEIEKKFNEQALKLNTQKGLNKQSLTTLQSLLNDWNIKKQSQNHKKLHYSLIHSKRITKTINNILHPRTTPLLSLYDTNGNLTSDPNAMCQSMGESLHSLGGPPSFDIDTSFIDKMMTNSAKLPNNVPHFKFTRHFFDHLLTNAKPYTAPSFDDTSLYLFSVVPHNIQTFIYNLCSTLATTNIPFHWLKAKIFLLYKKGDPHLPTNYRPIALPNSIYKILASYGASTLTYYSTTYKLTNNTEYGGLPNRRTTDHIFSMIANLSLHPDIYHLYLDLNKAFNSVPHNALWKILSNYNIPTYLINLIKNLYAAPYDYPIVNGFALFAAHCIRGLRQGCPMSPILFNPFVDPIILHIKTLLPAQEFHALFSFIDDIALQTKSPHTLHKMLHFLFTEGPLYGLSFNATKSELHALNKTPHVTIRISCSTHCSTLDNSGNPRRFCKYLGTYFFNQRQNTQRYQLQVNTINSFFTNLSTLPLTHNEIIKLSNNQLIPTLTYRLIYNSLPQDKLDKLDALIWTHISKSGKLSYCTPNKTEYSSNASFGLIITKVSITTHLQTINHTLRYSFRHGPQTAN